MDEFTQARIAKGHCCPVCADPSCPSRGVLLACQKLWGNPDISRVDYIIEEGGTQSLGVTFNREMVELEYDDSE